MVEDGCGSPLALPRPSVAANQTRDGHHLTTNPTRITMSRQPRFQINLSLSGAELLALESAAEKAKCTETEYLRAAMAEKIAKDAKKGAR
jgi:hypothetical protein